MKETIKKYILSKQFFRYVVVGGTGTLLDVAVLYVFKEFFGMTPVLSVVLNQILMGIYIYIFNKYWTFQSHGTIGGEMMRLYIVFGINYGIAILWMWLGHDILGIQYILVRLSNIACSTLWNFALYRLWVFKNKTT
ncbi:GtrA family protein [Candidatus Parcubacteria bacterium]|jgi:putative flippase GtrA|nr:MAG: GtrA family protein [Candidatus Parcubacteria bacterium]